MPPKVCEICGATWQPENRQHRKRICPECAGQCQICSGTHKATGLCAAHYMQYLRADSPKLSDFVTLVKAGVPLGRIVRECDVCGAEFNPYSAERCCSDECHAERKRKLDREYKRAEYHRKRNIMLARHKLYYQRHGKKWNKKKYTADMADPVRRKRVRKYARDFYRRNSERIQQRRRERLQTMLESMTTAQRDAYAERQREYSRDWRAKEMSDPERAARRKEYEDKYRRAKAREQMTLELIAALAAGKGIQ